VGQKEGGGVLRPPKRRAELSLLPPFQLLLFMASFPQISLCIIALSYAKSELGLLKRANTAEKWQSKWQQNKHLT